MNFRGHPCFSLKSEGNMSHLSKVLGIFRMEFFAPFGGSREDNPTWMVDFYGNIIHGSYVHAITGKRVNMGQPKISIRKKCSGWEYLYPTISAILLTLPCRWIIISTFGTSGCYSGESHRWGLGMLMATRNPERENQLREVGSWSHYLPGLFTYQVVVVWDFFNSILFGLERNFFFGKTSFFILQPRKYLDPFSQRILGIVYIYIPT